MEENYQADDKLQNWLQAEQWFLRGLGAALLMIAILGLMLGILYNPNNEMVITSVNVIITIVLGAGGVWALYTSTKIEYIEKAIEGYIEKGNSNSYAYAVVQFIFGGLFLLEGTSRGLTTMTLLALTLLISAGFFVWRGQQIGKHQL